MPAFSAWLWLLLVALCITDACCKIWEIPVPEGLRECYNRIRGANVETYVGSVYGWYCEHAMMMNASSSSSTITHPVTESYLQRLYVGAFDAPSRKKRQASSNRCIRKEYRMLTVEERQRFHSAVRALKADKSVPPNKYDAIAGIHTGFTNFRAHGGPGFPGWHRLFLLLFEAALREVDDSVCIPYWDSTLDNELPDPYLSSIWSADYLGTPRGAVRTGPCADWTLPSGGQLVRNAGVDGDLLSASELSRLFSRTSYEEIILADPQYDLEQIHGSVHVYVGGAMNRLETAARDIVFFLHHAFIDFIWELFRERMRSLGRNPNRYPRVRTNSLHASSAPTGFQGYTQVRAYSDNLANMVTYEPVPICSVTSQSCGNRDLVCNLSTGRCLPRERSGSSRRKRATASSKRDTCERSEPHGLPIQNDFCCDEKCDTKRWAMIPVSIVSMRPPKLRAYQCYPVNEGVVDDRRDIYAPVAYNQTNTFIASRQGNHKTYSRCGEDTTVGQIFVYSHGINYAGFYKESSIVDNRLPVSVSTGFVGIRRPPPGGVSTALIRAHDSCGRVCMMSCRDPTNGQYKRCSGAVAVNNELPHMFGHTLDEAVMYVFDYQVNSKCPRFTTSNLFLTIYCDYSNEFPYADES